MIGFLLLVMNYNHPFSANARIYFGTVTVNANVESCSMVRLRRSMIQPLQCSPSINFTHCFAT
jgi:hypothetical protein